MEPTCLLAIVEVPYGDRVRCMANGCGHSVYKQVHILRHGGSLQVYGSTCFAREFHGHIVKTSKPHLTGSVVRTLTSEERELLATNTERLIQQLESEHAAAVVFAAQTASLERERAATERAALIERASLVDFQPTTRWVSPKQFVNNTRQLRPKYSTAERASAEPEARQLLNSKYPGINFDTPGNNGLLQYEIDKILSKRKS